MVQGRELHSDPIKGHIQSWIRVPYMSHEGSEIMIPLFPSSGTRYNQHDLSQVKVSV